MVNKHFVKKLCTGWCLFLKFGIEQVTLAVEIKIILSIHLYKCRESFYVATLIIIKKSFLTYLNPHLVQYLNSCATSKF